MEFKQANLLALELVTQKFGKVIVKEIPGGNAVDYVCAYLKATGEDHTKADALRWLTNMFSQPSTTMASHATNASASPEWKLIRVDELEDLALIRYAARRGIPAALVSQHFVEAYVQHIRGGDRMFTLGFANEDGGYSLRNVFMKGCAGPQAVTFKRGTEPKSKAVHLFQDSFDYLSALLRFPQYVVQHDSIILNDASDVSEAFAYIAGYGYQTLYSWMPNNAAGNRSTLTLHHFAKTQNRLGHKPMNALYSVYKNINEWHIATKSIQANE